MIARRGARCLRTKKAVKKVEKAEPKALRQESDDLADISVFDMRGNNKIHSLSTGVDTVITKYPGIEVPGGEDGVPMYCTSNWIKIENNAKTDMLWGAVQDYEADASVTEFFHIYSQEDGEIVNIFTNVGCLFVRPKKANKEATQDNIYTNIAALDYKSSEPSDEELKVGRQVIYVFCDGFDAVEENNKIVKYIPINPRKIRAPGTDLSKVTFFFYSIANTPVEGHDKTIQLKILDSPYHFVKGVDDEGHEIEDNVFGKGTLKEGAPEDTPTPPGPGPQPDPEDPYAPVYPDGTEHAGEVIPGAHRIVNKETINDENVPEEYRGAFPVHKYVDGKIVYQEDTVIPVVDHYVFLYYLESGAPHEEEGEDVYGYWVNIIPGKDQVVAADEAVMLYKPIEEYVAPKLKEDDADGFVEIMAKVPAVYYYVHVLYHHLEKDVVLTVAEYKHMRYQNLGVDTELIADVEYVYGNIHIFQDAALLVYKLISRDPRTHKVVDLNIDRESSLINEGYLKSSDILQNELEQESYLP